MKELKAVMEQNVTNKKVILVKYLINIYINGSEFLDLFLDSCTVGAVCASTRSGEQ